MRRTAAMVLGGLALLLGLAGEASGRQFLCFMGGTDYAPQGCNHWQLPANSAPRVIVEVTGAAGGSNQAIGAAGATAVGRIDITPGGWLQFVLGTMGNDVVPGQNGAGLGGGMNGSKWVPLGYSGGGYSEVRVDPDGNAGGNCAQTATCPPQNAVIIGGGGGGMSSTLEPGGTGGLPLGKPALGSRGGQGGTASAGGAPGTPLGNQHQATAGTAYQGGDGGRSQCGAGGGGGGRYGGGGGAGGSNECGGGGGGSSMAPVGGALYTLKPYETNPFSGGNGFIVVHYGFDAVTDAHASSSTVALGNTVTSIATVTGDQTNPAPTGPMRFLVCGPLDPGDTGCPVLGEPIGQPNLAPIPNTKNSTATSPAYKPAAVGNYCFRAYYRGESPSNQNILGYGATIDADGDQCFTVTKGTSTTALAVGATEIKLGQTVTPQATLTGSTAPSGGTVQFRLCGPLGSAGPCSSSTNNQTVNVTGATVNAQAFTPTSAGLWCVGATYSGDANLQGSTAPGNSCFQVTKAASTTSVDPVDASLVFGGTTTASVLVTGNNVAGAPGGDASFAFCGPLGTAAACASGGTAGGTITLANAAGTSAGFKPTGAGIWCVRAAYLGSANYLESSAATAADCFTVQKAATGLTAAADKASLTLGETNTVSATRSGIAGMTAPSGPLQLSLCGPGASDCTSGGTTLGESVPAAGGAATSDAFTPPAPGAYCARTAYAGDANYLAASVADACFSVGKAAATGALAPVTPTATLAQGNRGRFVLTGNATGGPPSGDVEFFACGPAAEAASCDDAGARSLGTGTLTAGTGAAASADSPEYRPNRPGTYCLRAVYAGDGSYKSVTGAGTGACYAVPVPPAPSVTVVLPADGAHYAVGQAVNAVYACVDDPDSLGIESCTGPVAIGAGIDTATAGTKTFTVDAVSKSGQTATRTVSYVVDPSTGPPPAGDTLTVSKADVRANAKTGAIALTVTPSAGGMLRVIARGRDKRGRYVFGRKTVMVKDGGAVDLKVKPTKRGAKALRKARRAKRSLFVDVEVAFTPAGATQAITRKLRLKIR